jgi:hypothetical protein
MQGWMPRRGKRVLSAWPHGTKWEPLSRRGQYQGPVPTCISPSLKPKTEKHIAFREVDSPGLCGETVLDMIDLGLVPKFLKYPAEKNSKAQGKVF